MRGTNHQDSLLTSRWLAFWLQMAGSWTLPGREYQVTSYENYMLKIGLTQRVEVISAYGERRDCLDQAWTMVLSKAGMVAVPLPNLIENVESLFDETGLSGIILTGGNDLEKLPGASNTAPERDALERCLIELSADRNLPLLGVCRGMQMLVDHYGGNLTRVENHVANQHPVKVTSTHGLPLSNRSAVNSFHNFGVESDKIGGKMNILATAPDGTVEAAVHNSRPQWGIMWHPERDPCDHEDVALIRSIFLEAGH